jgi:putative membrane-bound dehydrogenase-like protein
MPPASPIRLRSLPALLLFGLFAAYPASGLGAGPKVPEGFEVRLLATVPAVTFPSQVATAPDGSLFVAEDPMDQVGPYEAYHGRILRFRTGQDPTTFADGFRAIQGMAWHDGELYVSHMPFLTVVKDTDGDGKADQRKDLFKDLGPTNNVGLNDHIVSGIQFGMDGWVYISVGDKGVPGATRPEDGQKVQLKGGGTLRCRPDGTSLEIFSSGTRNHLEANLDDHDNLFTYDNTDDGDGWWTRVTHHIDGGYYGYAYDYHHHPERFLPRMAEYGGGSPCGGVFYREDVWPEKYRNVGFWAEWGKGKVHAFRFEPDGSTFKVAEAIDFAVSDGVKDFRPIDLAVSYDGRTMYVADWGMGSWGSKTEKVGRIWAISYNEDSPKRPRGQGSDTIEGQIKQLDHPSFNERMRAQEALIKQGRGAIEAVTRALADSGRDPVARRHLVWTLDGIAGGAPEATIPILDAFKAESADVRAQAARALGVRRVPIAVEPLIERLDDQDPTVRLQAVIALGRIGDPRAIPGLLSNLAYTDIYINFSSRQSLRRIKDWKTVAEGLNTFGSKVRSELLLAMEGVYEADAVAALAAFAMNDDRVTQERVLALTYLAQVHRKAKPWDGKWWGTRPTQGRPPAKVDEWEGTALVVNTIRSELRASAASLRSAAVAGVVETRDREALPALRESFSLEPDTSVRKQLALALGNLKDEGALPLLIATLKNKQTEESIRVASLSALESIGTETATTALIELLAEADLPDERQPRVITALGKVKAKAAIPVIVEKLSSTSSEVRSAAAEALGKIGQTDGVSSKIRPLIEDSKAEVRIAAIKAVAALKDREALAALLIAADKEDTRFEASMALTSVPDTRSIHILIRNLTDKNSDLRKASERALMSIREASIPILEKLAERHELSPAAIPELHRVFTALRPVPQWRVLGPFAPNAKMEVPADHPIDLAASFVGLEEKPVTWKPAQQIDDLGQINLAHVCGTNDAAYAYAYAEFQSPDRRRAQMVVGSDDTLTVWLNGEKVYEFKDRRGFEHEQARVDVRLQKGKNVLLVKCGNEGGGWQFAVAVTSQANYAFLNGPSAAAFNPDAYRAFALKTKGEPDHGKALFTDLKGLSCVKCHALNGQGGNVGPDLTGIGAKYPREELIQSVLFPSQRIFSGYEPIVIATTDGRILTGILKSDTAEAVEMQDADAKLLKVPKAEIEARKVSDVSIMPNGLAEGLTTQDFADLVAFLESLKEIPPKSSPGR